MTVSNIHQLKQLLESLNTKPNKRLSQNFLIDANVVKKIIQTADVGDDFTIVEIGPGPGALTEELIKKTSPIFIIEKDPTFLSYWSSKSGVCIAGDDATSFNWDAFSTEKPCKIISNLPYHLTTELLSDWLPLYPKVATLTFMIQKDVLERLLATPKSEKFGYLSLLWSMCTENTTHFSVSKTCFYPTPNIDSVVVHTKLKKLPIQNPHHFSKWLYEAFKYRRKRLSYALSTMGINKEQSTEIIKKIGGNENSRAEELSHTQWFLLHEHFNAYF